MPACLVIAGFLSLGCGKPDITHICSNSEARDGSAVGQCTFSNKGDKAGEVCGAIVITATDGSGSVASSKFCSGEVGPHQDFTKVNYTVPKATELCGRYWGKEKCTWGFQELKGDDKLDLTTPKSDE